MADTFGPFDNANMGEAGWEKILETLSGVSFESDLVASASGVTARGVDLSPGTVVRHGFFYSTDTSREVVSAANTSGLSRIDRVVARVGKAANTVLPTVLGGTPSANPQPPSIADTDEPLWRWTVADGAGAVSNLVDERVFLTGPILFGKSTFRPVGRKKAQIFFETDTGRMVQWDGLSWVVLHEDTGWVTVSLQGHWVQSFNPLRVRKIGHAVNLSGTIRRGGEFRFLATDFEQIATLSTGFRPDFQLLNVVTVARTDVRSMVCRVSASGAVELDLDGENLAADGLVDLNMTWLVD